MWRYDLKNNNIITTRILARTIMIIVGSSKNAWRRQPASTHRPLSLCVFEYCVYKVLHDVHTTAEYRALGLN